jgi:hypothetical protein
MKKKYGRVSLFLGSALFGYIFWGNNSDANIIAQDIKCPDAQQQFECGAPTRTGQNAVKFEFVGTQLQGWTNITLDVSVSPAGNTNRVLPTLQIVPPIQLWRQNEPKDNGDWIILCRYNEVMAYGGSVLNQPYSTLTISAKQVKSCSIKDAYTITCTH